MEFTDSQRCSLSFVAGAKKDEKTFVGARVIFFVIGGMTYSEVRSAYELTKSNNREVRPRHANVALSECCALLHHFFASLGVARLLDSSVSGHRWLHACLHTQGVPCFPGCPQLLNPASSAPQLCYITDEPMNCFLFSLVLSRHSHSVLFEVLSPSIHQ